MAADHNSLWERRARLELRTVKIQLILIDRTSGSHNIKLFTRLLEMKYPLETGFGELTDQSPGAV